MSIFRYYIRDSFLAVFIFSLHIQLAFVNYFALFLLVLVGVEPTPAYVSLEDLISKKFNNVFFSARTTCNGKFSSHYISETWQK